MGRLVKQNRGISVELLLAILADYEDELSDLAISQVRQREVILAGSALRGGEVFLLEASDLIRRVSKGKIHDTDPHIVVPLMGRFKGETGVKVGLNPRRIAS